MKTPRIIPVVLFIAMAAMFTACGGAYFDENAAIDEGGWLPADAVQFDVEVDDTTQLFDFLVGVRNNVDYPYANLFLFVHTTFPDGSVAHDTIECPLADPTGQWYGRRTGRYVESRFRLRSTCARFPMTGTYTFAIANGMRDSAIAGIRDISLRIERSKMN